jgi:hypothetical protein
LSCWIAPELFTIVVPLTFHTDLLMTSRLTTVVLIVAVAWESVSRRASPQAFDQHGMTEAAGQTQTTKAPHSEPDGALWRRERPRVMLDEAGQKFRPECKPGQETRVATTD